MGRSPMNICDLIAILPFWAEQVTKDTGLESLRVFRVVRMTRVLRLLKAAKYSSGMRIMLEGVGRATQPLVLLLFMMMLGIVFFGSTIYYAERGVKSLPHWSTKGDAYPSIPDSFWWAIVTL